ncbi:hypothetical protein LJC37_01990 [Bacteroidales bacterium OttesenSCG-928-E04]|nr:hypothetical protein [Bacteroidales bacterium OttesenSCG-928-E04]MDL2326383.1 hypothetical protein [Bacteroidales bacterium OttesenSCG-928-A14]
MHYYAKRDESRKQEAGSRRPETGRRRPETGNQEEFINIIKPKIHYFCKPTMNAMKNSLFLNPELPTSYAGFPCSGLFSPVSEPWTVSREPCSHSSFSDFNFPGSDSFGFNGQEKDDEIYGEGASLSFEFRNYDSRKFIRSILLILLKLS